MNRVDPWPRAIFFDVGETLIQPRRPYGDLLSEVSRELDVNLPKELLSGLATRIEARVAVRTKDMLPFTFPADASQRFWFETYHGYFARFLSGPNAHRLAQGFLSLLSSPAGYTLFEDTVATLERFRAEGYRLGIISNWESWLPSLLESVDIVQFFDHLVISGECEVEKPDSRIFARALAVSGFRPEEMVYVGDKPSHDIEPALDAGIRPILLDRSARYPRDHRYQTIASLYDLTLALDQPGTGWRRSGSHGFRKNLSHSN